MRNVHFMVFHHIHVFGGRTSGNVGHEGNVFHDLGDLQVTERFIGSDIPGTIACKITAASAKHQDAVCGCRISQQKAYLLVATAS